MIGLPFNDLTCLGSITEVVAERVQFMSRTKGAAAGAPATAAAYADEPSHAGGGDDDVPF